MDCSSGIESDEVLTGSDGNVQRNERQHIQDLYIRRWEYFVETKHHRHGYNYLYKDEDLFAPALKELRRPVAELFVYLEFVAGKHDEHDDQHYA